MPRKARLDAPGTLHHVILRGIEKRRIVDDDEDRRVFVGRLGDVALETNTEIFAWSLMKNHAHILLRSGAEGLSKYMRRFLTGYALRYNRRHRRHGHLFQNRYKSIVCDEDTYFLELLRYIHLNPLRAKLVKDLSELDRYRWGGHSVVMGRIKHKWQNRDYILGLFGRKETDAKKAYRRFVKDGIEEGRRPDLVGGGLVRTLGGWSKVRSLRRKGERTAADERILGSGKFVEEMLKDANERLRCQLAGGNRKEVIKQEIEKICLHEGINMKELRMGSRRGGISEVRRRIALQLVEEHGIPLAEIAREVGVTTSAISNMFRRTRR
jgi:REP element-mobilizing transposase RayT